MPDYRRAWHPGGTYFFTANTLRRRGCTLLLLDHLHAVIELAARRRKLRYPLAVDQAW